MPRLTLAGSEASLDGERLRSGDLLELLVAGRRWVHGVFWSPGDHPLGPPGWHEGDGLAPSLRVPLAVPNEEGGGTADRWPEDEADFRPYATLYLRDGCVVRWVLPRRNVYLGAR